MSSAQQGKKSTRGLETSSQIAVLLSSILTCKRTQFIKNNFQKQNLDSFLELGRIKERAVSILTSPLLTLTLTQYKSNALLKMMQAIKRKKSIILINN